jgi:hypothetical protein
MKSKKSPMPGLRYTLEIYAGARHPYACFESASPFGAIAAGDYVNPNIWPGVPIAPRPSLRVSKVEHILWKSGHKILVSTEDVCVPNLEAEMREYALAAPARAEQERRAEEEFKKALDFRDEDARLSPTYWRAQKGARRRP